jgi:hypothetical protein
MDDPDLGHFHNADEIAFWNGSGGQRCVERQQAQDGIFAPISDILSGEPCKSSPVTGRRRCRMHGGANGSGAPTGARNGNFRHGRYTQEVAAVRRWLRECTKLQHRMKRLQRPTRLLRLVSHCVSPKRPKQTPSVPAHTGNASGRKRTLSRRITNLHLPNC